MIGPTALEIVNSLLTHVRTSAIKPANTSDSDDESNYREILLNTLAQFAIHLPDYQKIEIMTFIMSKVTLYRPESPSDITQYITLKCLLRVTMFYLILKNWRNYIFNFMLKKIYYQFR